jgi:type III pantothenate kinase
LDRIELEGEEETAGVSFLAIDIGNTNIKTGLFVGGMVEETLEVPSSLEPGQYRSRVAEWLGKDRFSAIGLVGIASVVRDLDSGIMDALERAFHSAQTKGPSVTVIGKDFPFPLKSAYQPGLLGADRMLAAVGAAGLFGKPVITVDIGSAVTIDFVDESGVFRGGLILAGGGFRAKALARFTSLLPEIPVPQSPPHLIGTSTVDCLSAGIYHGMRAEICGLVSQIQREVDTSTPVVLTGKGSRLFCDDLPKGWHLENWLVLEGIYHSCQGVKERSQKSGARSQKRGRETGDRGLD